MKRILEFVCLGAALSGLAACAGPNLASRIDAGMPEFDSWPEEVQETVSDGQIDIGFSEEQVEMAWGKPDYVVRETLASGETGERWVWEKKSPAIGIGIGLGTGGSRGGVSGGVGTTVGDRDRVKRSVVFQDGVVQSYSE
ncbi:hypothetical protein [Pelagicoccus sp. SDUM812002]|uniref:hypothetical protein n=1 Tax=Pelagicoccus sp. SDUM812002 TaxID=3041266 RepID=UPI00280E0C28|nr:hypothetical protein [Pelagicoccus sp. SDUM812002]MDQ8186793.1 hypothetical protein [Pelagicoccus sp. SDUM812002]